MKYIDISIIIPIYNGERYIEKLVKTIATYNKDLKYEVILINDYSTDNSLQICKKISKKDSNIKIINNKQNLGIANSRNEGLKKATGKYITFIDQDDNLTKGYSSFINTIKKTKCDFIQTNYLTDKDDIKENIIINSNNILCNKDEIIKLERFLFDPNLFPIENNEISIKSTIWNCIFSTTFIRKNKIHFFRFTSYEDDWLFIIECLKKAKRVYLSNDSYYSWTINNSSESHINKYIEDYFNKSIDLLNYAIKSLKETGLNDSDLKTYKIRCNTDILLWNFYNECEAIENISNNKNVQSLINYYQKDINVFISNSNLFKKVMLTLIKNKMYKTAKFIQKNITKRKYV